MKGCVTEYMKLHGQHGLSPFYPRANSNKTPLPHYGQLPAVTHVNVFQNAWKMTSRRCVFARTDFTKKTLVYYLIFDSICPDTCKIGYETFLGLIAFWSCLHFLLEKNGVCVCVQKYKAL